MPLKLTATIGADNTFTLDGDFTGDQAVQLFRDWVNKVGLPPADDATTAAHLAADAAKINQAADAIAASAETLNTIR